MSMSNSGIEIQNWEDDLLQVALNTPDWAAKQILERNQVLLDQLISIRAQEDNGWPISKDTCFHISIGCPHCSANCDRCLYTQVYGNICSPEDILHFHDACLKFYFGKYRYMQVRGLTYTPTSAGFVYHDCNFPKISNFLRAHIQWATRMIDGTYRRYVGNNLSEYILPMADGNRAVLFNQVNYDL